MYRRWGKRLIDIALSLTGIIVFSPFFILTSIAIILEDGYPVLFSHKRIGRSEKVFTLYKFRSMRNGNHKVETRIPDDRVTKVGYLLRKSGMDSLPELFNILLGDMSVVGVRPMPLMVTDEPGYTSIRQFPLYYNRTSVRPGWVGLAQIKCSKTASRIIKFQWDAYYVKYLCWSLDAKIFVSGISKLFRME